VSGWEGIVTLLIALYLIALSISICFFLWAAYCQLKSKRRPKEKPSVDLSPGTDATIVALYCQYLVAPQTALREAQQALSLLSSGRAAIQSGMPADFLEIIELLQSRSPASSR
jgi:hypothetical protein